MKRDISPESYTKRSFLAASLGWLSNLLPVGVAAAIVRMLVIGIHLPTLSQQVSASTASVAYTSEGLPITIAQSDTSKLHQNILASGGLCPIHSLGLFGFGSSEST